MATETEEKVAMSLLDEVEGKVRNTLGNKMAHPYDPDYYDAGHDHWSKEMVKQCELAEKKASDSRAVLLRSNLLKAQIYGNWSKPTGQRGTHNNAVEAYEKSLELGGDEAEIRYRMALLLRVHGQKSKAIENFERVIQIAGENSELGIECAKELEKEKAKKGCFIATAVYGSYFSPEVIILRSFRDNMLSENKIGQFFIQFYYFISPPIAKFISKHFIIKKAIDKFFLGPIIRIYSSQAKQ